jgi:cytochrome bd-type quinol oxidase subunit 1
VARAGPSLVEGVRDPVRRRSGVGDDHQLRTGGVVATVHGFHGGIIGLPFSLEGAAFFLEAVFVGIHLHGWDRISPRLHWLSGFPIALASVASAFFIVTANAWLNVPRGFQIVPGEWR